MSLDGDSREQGETMSAFVVGHEHIDALVEAAQSVRFNRHDSGLSWYDVPNDQLRALPYEQISDHRRTISYSDPHRASEVGMMLWAENLASIEARYPDTAESGEYPGPCDFTKDDVLTYTHTRGAHLEPVQVLKALACYEYQTCEHDGWPTSEAAQFCDALRHKMISALPGYDEAAWEVDSARV